MLDIINDVPSTGPTEKERKYDRQLRLWAASGQAALENARVLLVNSGGGTVGVETLKNLVLPGIGHFTIFDEALVTDADLGVNFFLDHASIGKSRAECCTKFLLELNPEVEGDWLPKFENPGTPSAQALESKRMRLSNSPSASAGLAQQLQNVAPFTVILYSLPINPELEDIIRAYGTAKSIPVFSVHSVGFYAYFHIRYPGPFLVVETHPDQANTTDLRLLRPWPELEIFCAELTADIDSQEPHIHGHIPFVAILLHYLQEWRMTHDGSYPLSYSQKNEFRKLVMAAMRTDNVVGGEENYEEASAAVMRNLGHLSVPSNLKEVFDFVDSGKVNIQESSTWTTVKAVKLFFGQEGYLPLPGGIPDMKAQPHVYVALQNIYKSKARADVQEVVRLARTLPGGDSVTEEEVNVFCKNASFVKLVNGQHEVVKSLQEICDQEFTNDETAAAGLMPFPLLPIYLALKTTSHIVTSSSQGILSAVADLVPNLGGAQCQKRIKEAAEEVARAGGSELHNISAAVGGMIAQEMIKVVTGQYVPIDNTCIYDGIKSRCQILRL